MNRTDESDPRNAGQTRAERFEAAYRELYAPIGAYVLRRLSSPEESAEVVAETFLTLWRRFDEAPAGDALRPWTYGVARRVMANHRRGERRRAALSERLVTDLARLTQQAPDPAESVDDLAQLRAAMAQLSEPDRELLRLIAWEGLTTDEIAIALDARAGAVRLRLHRARRRLAAALGTDNQPKQPPISGHVVEQRETNQPSRMVEGTS